MINWSSNNSSTMNRKVGKLVQWTNEKLGEKKLTERTDDFKALEAEMAMRQEGMEKLQSTCSNYLKSLSKKKDTDELTKSMPVALFSLAMREHSRDLDSNSAYGHGLSLYGGAQYQVAKRQDEFCRSAHQTYLANVERFLVQMKDFNAAKKKLEGRRLALDATQTKLQKAKKEDPKLEEEVRLARYKYDESTEDVLSRMDSIQEAEKEHLQSLEDLMDVQAAYFEDCAAIMKDLKAGWRHNISSSTPARSRPPMPKANTTVGFRPTQSKSLHSPRPPLARAYTSADVADDDDAYSLQHKLSSNDSLLPTPPPEARVASKDSKLLRAIYSFDAEQDTELALNVGDCVRVLEENPSGWWLGETCNEGGQPIKAGGRSGYFPVNYTKTVRRQAPPPKPSGRPPSQVFSIRSASDENESGMSKSPFESSESPFENRTRSSSISSFKSPLSSRNGAVGDASSPLGIKGKRAPPPPPPHARGLPRN